MNIRDRAGGFCVPKLLLFCDPSLRTATTVALG